MLTIKIPYHRCNFTFITDIHLSAVPPGRRTGKYQEEILDKLRFVSETTHKIHGIGLCGGDFFHVKNSRSPANSLEMICSAIEVLQTFPENKVFGAIGNHDLLFDTIIDGQPIDVLISAGVYHDLSKEPILFVNEDESVKVLVEALPYAPAKTLESILNPPPRPEGVTHRIGIVHAYGQPGNAGDLFGERIIGYNEVKDSDYDFLLWGHDHSRKETVTIGKTTHIHLGSLSRAALDYDEVDRPISCAIVSFAKDAVRYKEQTIPVKPLDIAFTKADKGMEKIAQSDDIKTFFKGMDEQISGMDTTDTREVIKQLCTGEPKLETLILDLCEIH